MEGRTERLPKCMKVSQCGTDIANGLYKADVKKRLRHGAYRYVHTRYQNLQITKEKTRTGLGWILGDPFKKMVYYAVKGDFEIPPKEGWREYLGSGPVPIIQPIHSRRSLENVKKLDSAEEDGITGISREPSGFLGKAVSKAQEQRKMVYDEITNTEEQYVEDMKCVLSLFAEPMERDSVLTKKQIVDIFSNLDQIVAVNRSILHQIKARRKSQVLSKVIADVFHEYAPRMGVYATYCINYHNALRTVKQLKSTNDRFVQYLDDASKRDELRGLNLESMLIKPVQRICKYQLFLRDLLKNMDKDHKNRSLLEKALADVKSTASKVNAAMQESEATRKVVEIYNSVLDLPDDLVAPSRKFEAEAKVRVDHVGYKDLDDVEFRMIVFTDLLILSQQQQSFWGGEKTGIYRCTQTFDLRNLTTVHYEPGSKKFEFKYKKIKDTTTSVSKYVFTCTSAGSTERVAGVLQNQVNLSKERASRQEKRASTRTKGLRKFHAHKRVWSRGNTRDKSSLKDIENRYRKDTTEAADRKGNSSSDTSGGEAAEEKPAAKLRSWAAGRKGNTAGSRLSNRRMPQGLKRADKKALLNRVATLEREKHERVTSTARTSAKKNAAFRESCYMEIADTEKKFFNDMRTLLEKFMDPMLEKKLLTKTEAAVIFRNVREIKNLSGELFNALNAPGQRSETFAAAFTRYSPFFDMYAVYCSGYGRAVDCLKERRKKDARLQKWLAAQSDSVGLESLLVKPVQRICKYPLFFKGLLKHMETDHPSRTQIEDAMRNIKIVASKVDGKVKTWSERARVLDVYNTVKDCPEDLVKPQRRLVKQLSAMVEHVNRKKTRPMELFVFNDIVLLVRSETKKSWTFKKKTTMNMKRLLHISHLSVKLDSAKANTLTLIHKEIRGASTIVDKYRATFATDTECENARNILSSVKEDATDHEVDLYERSASVGVRSESSTTPGMRKSARRKWSSRRAGGTGTMGKDASLRLLERRYKASGEKLGVNDKA